MPLPLHLLYYRASAILELKRILKFLSLQIHADGLKTITKFDAGFDNTCF